MIKIFRMNTGSCGACDQIIDLSVHADRALSWAETIEDADVVLLTGPITPTIQPLFMEMLRRAAEKPLVAVGQCAIDGRPFGQGGVAAQASLESHPRISRVEGCPVTPERVAEVIRQAVVAVPRRSEQ